jgi:hypothetical protein
VTFGEAVRQCGALVRLYLLRLAVRKEIETWAIEPDVAIESWRYGGVSDANRPEPSVDTTNCEDRADYCCDGTNDLEQKLEVGHQSLRLAGSLSERHYMHQRPGVDCTGALVMRSGQDHPRSEPNDSPLGCMM